MKIHEHAKHAFMEVNEKLKCNPKQQCIFTLPLDINKNYELTLCGEVATSYPTPSLAATSVLFSLCESVGMNKVTNMRWEGKRLKVYDLDAGDGTGNTVKLESYNTTWAQCTNVKILAFLKIQTSELKLNAEESKAVIDFVNNTLPIFHGKNSKDVYEAMGNLLNGILNPDLTVKREIDDTNSYKDKYKALIERTKSNEKALPLAIFILFSLSTPILQSPNYVRHIDGIELPKVNFADSYIDQFYRFLDVNGLACIKDQIEKFSSLNFGRSNIPDEFLLDLEKIINKLNSSVSLSSGGCKMLTRLGGGNEQGLAHFHFYK